MTSDSEKSASGASVVRRFESFFARNLALGLTGKVVQFSVSFFLIGYLVHRLGKEGYGLVIIATSTMAFLSLIQASVSSGLAKLLNALYANNDIREVQAYFSAGVVLSGSVVLLILLGIWLIQTLFWGWMNIPAAQATQGHLVFTAVGLSLCVNCLGLPVSAALQAMHRLDIVELSMIIASIGRLVLTIIIFEAWAASPTAYAAAMLTAALMAFSLNRLLLLRLEPRIRLSLASVRTAVVKDTMSLNALTFFNNANYIVFMQGPVFFVQNQLGLEASGNYGICMQLNNLVRAFGVAGLAATQPMVMSLQAVDDIPRLQRLFSIMTKTYIAGAVFLALSSVIFGLSFVEAWLGRDLPDLSLALPLLICTGAAGVAALPATAVLTAYRRLKVTSVAGLSLGIVMLFVLDVVTDTSDIGTALSRTASCLCIFFALYQLLRVLLAADCLRLGIRFVLRVSLRSAAPAIAVLTIAAVLGGWSLQGAIPILLVGALCAIAWGLLCLLILYDTEDRSMAIRAIWGRHRASTSKCRH